MSDAEQYRDLDDAALAAAEASFFGPPISTYTRAQAIEDGALIDVTETARAAGFTYPCVVTAAVWEDCIAWTEQDRTTPKRACQDEAGRLWDVLWMARSADAKYGRPATYRIKRVPRPGRGHTQLVILKLHVGPGDDGAPVLTIMQPDED